jgi:hypothetical protein
VVLGRDLSFTLRFMLDRVWRVLRSLANGGATPSGLDLKLGVRLLAKSPGLALVGGLGMAVAIALGAGAYAAVNSYFYPELPLPRATGRRDRQVRPVREYEDERLLHDFLVWRRELRTVVDLGAFRTVQRNLGTRDGAGRADHARRDDRLGLPRARVPALRGRTLSRTTSGRARPR